MTSQERRDRTALRAGDRSLRNPIAGVANSEDIRLAEREESHSMLGLAHVIANGYPADREIVRRQAIERISQYSGSQAFNHLLPIYRDILARVEAAILADAERHLKYLWFCVERDERQLERARVSRNPFSKPGAIEVSIARYRSRIAEIALRQSSEASALKAEEQSGAPDDRGEVPTASPLVPCPA